MATLMLENGVDSRFIQAMLGHVKLDTTQIYMQVSIKKLKEIHTLTLTHPDNGKCSREELPEAPEGNEEALLKALAAEGDEAQD